MDDEKRAVAGLWAVPGVGAMTVARLREKLKLADLVDCLIGEWFRDEDFESYAADRIPRSRTLAELGDDLLERAARHQMKIAWLGEPGYPELLARIPDAPPMLFYWGPGTDCPPRRRLAMVGSRHPDPKGARLSGELAFEVGEAGIGVVSGAAKGIDTICHTQCALARGETWAFLGSALDQLDTPQATLWSGLRDRGATFWSELPPGVRSAPQNFPRRNRLITGASNALAVMRANFTSGTRYSIQYAREQNRPMLAMPGERDEPMTELCNAMLEHHVAGVFTHVRHAERILGMSGYASHKPAPVETKRVDVATLSPQAQTVFAAIEGARICFDDLLPKVELQSSQLLSALFELITSGLVHEYNGRRYERAA